MNWNEPEIVKETKEMNMIMTVQEVTDLVIEDLVDSDFRSGDHEAYGYITDRVVKQNAGRTGAAFISLLDDIDWDFVESEVKRLKIDDGDPTMNVLDDIDFHINQIEAAMKDDNMKIKDWGGFLSGAISVGTVMLKDVKRMRQHVEFLRDCRNLVVEKS